MWKHLTADSFLHQKGALIALGIVLLVSLYVRLDGITQNEFFYYDEGYYFTKQRAFDDLVSPRPPRSAGECLQSLGYNFQVSLCTDKPLWFFLLHLRSLAGAFDALYISRIFSAVFGILTVLVTFAFSLRLFQSRSVAILSTVILACLPGHVFYSRLGLQEALSTFCLLLGFYLYLFPNRFGWRTFASGVFFALSYFSNYRMFILPAAVLLAEVFLGMPGRDFKWRRYAWSMVTFGVMVVIFGLLNDACHFKFVFQWMLRQAGFAKEHLDVLSLLSYPYIMFRLEGIVFGLLFFSNVFLMKKHWKETLPFVLVILQMLIFSFAHEKGARYVAVVMPFMAIAVAGALYRWYGRASCKGVKILVVIAGLLMGFQHIVRAFEIRSFNSSYREAIEEVLRTDPGAKVLSTQAFIQNLFTGSRETVEEPPHDFVQVLAYYQQGYTYIMLDPQAYISYTKSKERFDPPLDDHLEFLFAMSPLRVYDHFSDAMLERFVLEHNVYLSDSIKFLKANKDKQLNRLRVYRTKDYIDEVMRRLEHRHQRKNQPGG